MGKRPRRKIVLFLVEGKSDRCALQLAIPELYDRLDEDIEVFFPTIREDNEEKGGDITSKFGIHPRNIEPAIYDLFLKDFFDEQKILPKDVTEIIHIVDLDGTYIDDQNIYHGVNPTGEVRTYYDNNKILSENPERIIKRNQYKRENLDYLAGLDSIKVKQKTVKYSIYYFSSNLDHYLHNNANLESFLKRPKAEEFSQMYLGNTNAFISFMSDDTDGLSTLSYRESWEYIKSGNNSLQRHTNIGILLNSLKSIT